MPGEQDRRNSVEGIYVDELSLSASILKTDTPVDQGKQGVVLTQTYILTGFEWRAALSHKNRSRRH
jgi:hypothetical protein